MTKQSFNELKEHIHNTIPREITSNGRPRFGTACKRAVIHEGGNIHRRDNIFVLILHIVGDQEIRAEVARKVASHAHAIITDGVVVDKNEELGLVKVCSRYPQELWKICKDVHTFFLSLDPTNSCAVVKAITYGDIGIETDAQGHLTLRDSTNSMCVSVGEKLIDATCDGDSSTLTVAISNLAIKPSTILREDTRILSSSTTEIRGRKIRFHLLASIEEPRKSEKPIKTLILHASADKQFLKALRENLTVQEHISLIKCYDFEGIEAGQDTQVEMERLLNAVDIVIPLVSPSLFADNQLNELLESAIARHHWHQLKLMSVLIRSCDWGHSCLQSMQMLLKHAPISSVQDQDTRWTEVTESIAAIAKELLETSD